MTGLIADIDVLDKTNEADNCEFNISIEGSDRKARRLYIESYGCQMNFSDSEIVTSILNKEGFDTTSDANDAEVILINTCSIREKAEQTIRNRLNYFNSIKKKNPDITIGVLGCMAERLKSQLLDEEKIVDLVVGPDAYRDLPKLVERAEEGERGINTFLSKEETYADITPVRLNSNGVTAYISIMRGCDNMCSFCVVPFTRGRERSRDPDSIVQEAQDLFKKGYREVTLLGQNVDSFKWYSEKDNKSHLAKKEDTRMVNFANLLEMVASVDPDLRVRFSTSHPKDITDEVLYTIKKLENICNYVHLPAQSGNSRILELMNRTYDRKWYIGRVAAIREILGEECGISSDMIAGFCSETEEEHQDTLTLMDHVQYDYSYMFFYSERSGTLAAKKYTDDIPLDVKKLRLQEIMSKQHELSLSRNKRDIGKTFKVLIEGKSKKSDEKMQGRNSTNKVVIFPSDGLRTGQYINVHINDCSAGTLFGEIV
ncbi:MAG: tRNA (N6-isopentenyl adenosine(37)-C2)-methylthiotransferase MiaB [Cytophagales bacterium]|nr:tRNA (N6-isopentenyl adenosine(37)-C2)-methylthiotransferase MiaB [Cytophagales bacterium]